MKIKIDPKKITAWLKARGLSYEDIQIQSGGSITIDQIKYAMSKSLMMKESQLHSLANILNCELDDLADSESLRLMEIPVNIQLRVYGLYSSTTKNFNQAYREYMNKKKKIPSYQSLLHQAASLYMILTEKQSEEDEYIRLQNVKFFILAQFTETTQTVLFESISNNTMSWFKGNLSALPEDEYFAISLFVFAYCLLVLNELLHYELVSSAIFLSSYRHREVVNQYAALALPMEKMCIELLDAILNKGGIESFEQLKSMQFEETIMEKILLTVSTTKQIVNHINLPSMASEYLNRSKVDSIVQELIGALNEMGLSVEFNTMQDFVHSRFGRAYLDYRHTRALFDTSESKNAHIRVDSIESENLTSYAAGISKEFQDVLRVMQACQIIRNFNNPTT